MAIGTIWLDPEDITLSEVSKTERRVLYDILYMESKKKET